MTDRYAYRCSPEMSEAVYARALEQQEFRARVWDSWMREHPGIMISYRRQAVSTDLEVMGFQTLGAQDKTTGLSWSHKRGYAAPVRGPRGEPWRQALARLREYPSMDEAFADFGVPTGTSVEDATYAVALEFSPERILYLECGGDLFDGLPEGRLPSTIRRVAMQELDAVRESNEAIREAAKR
jgi:hypothetical protein